MEPSFTASLGRTSPYSVTSGLSIPPHTGHFGISSHDSKIRFPSKRLPHFVHEHFRVVP